ncbi:MAG: AI-2E family transporter [Roseiflexaceae bacterium]
MKRFIQIIVTIAVTLLGILLLWVFQPALVLFGGSLAISAALRPLVLRLEERGVGRGLAILIWYLLLLAGLVIGALIYGVGLADEATAAAERLPQWYESTVAAWQQGAPLQQMVARGLPDFEALLQGLGDAEGLAVAGGALLGLASGIVGDLIFLFAALSLAYYWLIEATHFERLWLSLLPVGARVRAREIWRNVEGAVGAYIRATVVAMTVAGILLLTVYTLLDLPFKVLLALLGGLSQMVPRLGPALGLLLAVLVALAVSPLEAALVLASGALVQILAHQLATRMLKARSVKVNPLLQVLLILALADVGGFLAIVFAPPLAALIQVLYANLLTTSATAEAQPGAIDVLSERLARLRAQADPDHVELSSTLKRSDGLLQQARAMLDDGRGAQAR